MPAGRCDGHSRHHRQGRIGGTIVLDLYAFLMQRMFGVPTNWKMVGPDGRTRDIPGSDALLVHVMWPSTPAGWQCLAYRHCACCVRP